MPRNWIIRDILSRRDPQGYYVVVADRRCLELLRGEEHGEVVIEDLGDILILRTKSRSIAEKIARLLLTRGLLRGTP